MKWPHLPCCVLLFFTLQLAYTLHLTAANPNGTSLIFSWKSDVFSSGTSSSDGTRLYALFSSSDSSASIASINLANPLSPVPSTTVLSGRIDSLAGVWDEEDLGFTTSLSVFVLSSGNVVLQSPLAGQTASKILYGPARNTVVVLCNNASFFYAYNKASAGLVKLASNSATMHSELIRSSRHDTVLYCIVSMADGNYLQVFDYLAGTVKVSVKLPDAFLFSSILTKMLLSYSEDYIALCTSPQFLIYSLSNTSLIANFTRPFSALAVAPFENWLVAKDEVTSAVYVISLETGKITSQLSIHEKDYFNHMYVRQYAGKTVVTFTNYLKWHAYYLETESEVASETLVNNYVIVLSVILSLVMIVSVIYLVCKTKQNTESEQSPPVAQPQPNQDSGARLQVPRRDAYQVPVPRTLDTHMITDFNESAVNLSHGNEPLQSLRKLLMCPLTGVTFRFPVVAADGYTYEKDAIEAWFRQNEVSPATQEALENKNLIANKTVANYLAGIPH